MLFLLWSNLILVPNGVLGSVYWHDGAYHDDSSTSQCVSNNPNDVSGCCSSADKCGVLQGDCDDDSDCSDGLTCLQNGNFIYFESNPANTTDVCHPQTYSLPDFNTCVEYGVDFPGNDLIAFSGLDTWQDCFDKCLAYPSWECTGVAYVTKDYGINKDTFGGSCWLKSAFSNRNPNMIIGFMSVHRNCLPGCSHPNSDAIYGGGTELQDVTLEQCQRRCREVQDCVGGTYFNAWEWNLVRCYIKETYLPDAPDKKFTAFRAFCGYELQPDGWLRYKHSEYLVETSVEISYQGAQAACQAQGAYLLEFDSENEHNFIEHYMRKELGGHPNKFFVGTNLLRSDIATDLCHEEEPLVRHFNIFNNEAAKGCYAAALYGSIQRRYICEKCNQPSSEYHLTHNRYYKTYSSKPKTFGAAQRQCQDDQGQLPSIRTLADIDALVTLLPQQDEFYIGIELPSTSKMSPYCSNSQCDELGFTWGDGRRFKYDPGLVTSVKFDVNAWCFFYHRNRREIRGKPAVECRDSPSAYVCQSSCRVPCQSPPSVASSTVKNLDPSTDFHVSGHPLSSSSRMHSLGGSLCDAVRTEFVGRLWRKQCRINHVQTTSKAKPGKKKHLSD